jgi:hypothetical protein
VTPAQIEQLCNDWCASSSVHAGTTESSSNTEKHRLLANGVVFHELNFESLCAALTGTSKALLLPGLNCIAVQDHFWLWAWCAEVLLSCRAPLFSKNQMEIRSLFETTVRAALAGCRPPIASREEWKAQNEEYEIRNHHARYFVQNSELALAYLAFPLLEAMTKRACAAFVTLNGRVTAKFSVPRKNGGVRPYALDAKCSSLRDLLHLLHSTVATPQLKQSICKLRGNLAKLDSTQDPFDIIYSWRNDSLHGSANFQTIGGTLLTWCFLIALADLESNFESHRHLVSNDCRRDIPFSHRPPWSFYPPY